MNGDEGTYVRFLGGEGEGRDALERGDWSTALRVFRGHGLLPRTIPAFTPSWRGRREQETEQETARRKEMWGEFAQLPGTHLLWGSKGRPAELLTAEQQTIATVRGTFGTGIESRGMTVSAGGRNFTLERVLDAGWPRSWPPGIAEIVGHREGQKLTWAVRARAASLGWLVDETGTPVLYASGQHYNHRARACITFPDRRWLEFPVWRASQGHAIMTAEDQDGNEVAQYRAPSRFRQTVEITVHWDLTDELVLVIAISAPWFNSYFESPWQGGG